MEENKNQEMSVAELLEKLKASLAADQETEKTSVDSAVEETEEIEAPEVDEAPEIGEAVTEEEPEAAEETVVVEESVVPETAVEPEEVAAVEEPAIIGQINEEDIFAAWGIDREEAEQQKTEIFEIEKKPSVEAPVASTVSIKIYHITRVESKTDFALRKQTEAQKNPIDYDRTDYSLIKQALGMEQPAEDASASQEFYAMESEAETASFSKTLDVPHAEFTYQRQKEDFVADYKRARRISGLKLLFTAIVATLLLAVECLPAFGLQMPQVLSKEYYPVVYAMVTMQLAWLAGALSYKEIANGFLGVLKLRLSSGSILGVLLLATTACDIANCALGMTAPVYNFAVAFSALLIRIYEYMGIRREMLAFDIASSTAAKKLVAVCVPSTQVDGLEEYTGEESLVLRTEKCSFVENYFARTEKRSDGEIVSNKYIVPLILVFSAIVAILSAVNDHDAAASVAACNAVLAVGMPVLILMSSAYPLYKATRKLARRDSTIVGETSVDEYAGTTMICFDDADAFPSYGVALENLRVYGKGDIETIIEQMDAIFSKLGGPLRHVFSLMIAECPKPYRVKIEGIHEDGICAVVDGSELYVGNAAYMEANGIAVMDKTTEIGGKQFSTMYLAEDGALRAKFFIRYTLDGSFESIVKKLARRGIASVILTGDANINDALLARSLDITKLPVKVVRRNVTEGVSVGDRADSGIVSTGAISDLVSAVTMCDRLASVLGTMRAVRIASAVICAILAVGATLLGVHTMISSAYVLLYHLFWLIPAWLVAKINL